MHSSFWWKLFCSRWCVCISGSCLTLSARANSISANSWKVQLRTDIVQLASNLPWEEEVTYWDVCRHCDGEGSETGSSSSSTVSNSSTGSWTSCKQILLVPRSGENLYSGMLCLSVSFRSHIIQVYVTMCLFNSCWCFSDYVFGFFVRWRFSLFSCFFPAQELADPDQEKGEKSVFYLLLKMFVSSNSSYLKTSTRMLVLKVSSTAPNNRRRSYKNMKNCRSFNISLH